MTTDIDALVERPDNAPASYDAVVEAYEHMRDLCRQAQDGWSEERRKLWRAIDENARLREALEGYRAAVQWVAADSWDGCSDCIEILQMAANQDDERAFSPDEHAKALKRLRARAALQGDA